MLVSPRGTPPVVHCCVCGERHSSASKAVLYRSADGLWWCADERSCYERRDATIAAMGRAWNDVLAELEAAGWMWPA